MRAFSKLHSLFLLGQTKAKRNLRVRFLTLALAVPAFVAPALTGCGPSGRHQKAAKAKGPEEKPPRGKVKEQDPVSEKGKQWGGWRWKGKNNECYYVFNNRCFEKEELACKAAKCSAGCKVKEGAPSRVSCKK